MIIVSKLNGEQFALNCDLIETVSEDPDTRIHLTNGNFYIVQESTNEIVKKIVEFRRKTFRDLIEGTVHGC